jgi:hypothetical protein
VSAPPPRRPTASSTRPRYAPQAATHVVPTAQPKLLVQGGGEVEKAQ